MAQERVGDIKRKTAETDIVLQLVLDGRGESKVATGVPFFDHLLTLLARHAMFDLDVAVKGDVEVDYHHTVEDVGIALGDAVRQAIGDKKGLVRYGFFILPMDECLGRVAIDLGGRPFLAYRGPDGLPPINGNFAFTLVEEFLRAFTNNAGINLHVEILYGRDAHHMAEAVFKGLARAVDQAVQLDSRVEGVPSTKGSL